MAPEDRTDELIAAMLARRAAQPMPDGLLEATITAVAADRQARAGGPRGARARSRPSWPVLAGALVVVVAALAGAAVVAGVLAPRGQGEAGPAAIAATPSAAAPPASSPSPTPPPVIASPSLESSGEPPASPAPTLPPPVVVLEPDSLAVVTPDGTRLRVRSRPGTGNDSEMLEPLLSAGTRLLVIQGPVNADGLDWYQVLPELEPYSLFGWVATGREGVAWIEAATPDCPEALDLSALVSIPRFNLLTCFGRQPTSVTAWLYDIRDSAPNVDLCRPAESRPRCVIRPKWLADGVRIAAGPYPGNTTWLDVHARDTVRDALLEAPIDRGVRVFGYLDAPEADTCQIVDGESGDRAAPARHGIALCKLRFVVTALDWDAQPTSMPSPLPSLP